MKKNFTQYPHFGHKLYFLRHGETEWSKSGKHTGRTDIPLTENGISQAKALASRIKGLSFKKVFTSSLQRAKNTCEICGLIDQAIIDDDLLEWNYGIYEGRKTSEIRKEIPDWSVFTHPILEGESIDEVSSRADRMIEKILQVDGDVAVFSSGHFLRVLAARWTAAQASYGAHLKLSTATFSLLSYEHENSVIETWNDSSHLNVCN